MSLLIEDTARNTLAAWTVEALAEGYVDGAVLSPFVSPLVRNNYKQACRTTGERVSDAGGNIWLDVATHALQMPGVGDFRYYDQWDLWDGDWGELGSRAQRRDHVHRVLDAQRSVGASPLAPSVLMPAAAGDPLQVTLSLAEEMVSLDDSAYITIAGTPSFWAGGADLDAYVGALAQVGASGFFLVVARATTDLPVSPAPGEVAGLCRSARSLSQFGEVHVSHGDIAALPAIAAGATSVGTGWDTRQRVCSYTSYTARESSGSGGGWFQRPTFRGLLAFVQRAEAERLASQDAALSRRLHVGALHPDAPKEAFLHHVSSLSEIISAISAGTHAANYRALDDIYEQSEADWSLAVAAGNLSGSAGAWIRPFREGLQDYGRSEGFI